MRIISGTEKGRKLLTPRAHDQSIRPTSDRAREALFSIIGQRVVAAKVLDLFAGTGAFGLEAFSRQAGCVVFIDNNRLALDLIKKNINLCLSGHAVNCGLRVIHHDLTKALPINCFPPETQAGFDLIFADPPYSTGLSLSILETIDKNCWLRQKGMLIVEERFNVALPDELNHLHIMDKRVYGENAFWLYEFRIPSET